MEIENAGVDEEVLGAEDEQELNDEPRAPEDQEDDTDWKAVAEAERERAENYKKALSQKRGLRKRGTTETEEEPEDDGEDTRSMTRAEFQQAIQDTVVPLLASSKVDSVLAEKVKDPAKRAAVKLIYENRIRQTGTSDEAIREDIESAIGIADRRKVSKMASEMERSRGNDRTPPLAGPSNERGPERRTHGFTDTQVKELTAKASSLRIDPEKFIQETWKNSKK